jgi:hypothetical protein
MPKNHRNAPNAPMITHPAIAETDSLLIAPPIAPVSANAPTTKHQTYIGSSMIGFFSTILDKNLSPICVVGSWPDHSPSGNSKCPLQAA